MSDPIRVSVIGAGSWGTALAFMLAEKGHSLTLWVYETDLVDEIKKDRENRRYLPGVRLPQNIIPTSSLEEAAEADLLLFVVPSHVSRKVLKELRPHLAEGTPLINATKGIETDTLMLMSQVIQDVLPPTHHDSVAVLSGPSFAKEVCQKLPTAVVLAAADHALAQRLQGILTTPLFKVYTSPDVIGVQLGGALKNVIAIASGGADGLGFGHNTRAALIARGLVEIMRLGKAMGADPATFFGLSGIGDLVLTCTGELSRNKTVGYQMGKGKKLPEILSGMTMVAEGINTAKSAYHLAKKHSVEMPIVEQIHAVLFEGKDPRAAVVDLMERAAGDELPPL